MVSDDPRKFLTGELSNEVLLTSGPFDKESAYLGRRGSTTGSFISLPSVTSALRSTSKIDNCLEDGLTSEVYNNTGRRASNFVGFDAQPRHAPLASNSIQLQPLQSLSFAPFHDPLWSFDVLAHLSQTSSSPSVISSRGTHPSSPTTLLSPLPRSQSHVSHQSSPISQAASEEDPIYPTSSTPYSTASSSGLLGGYQTDRESESHDFLARHFQGHKSDGVPMANKINLERIALGLETRLTVMLKGLPSSFCSSEDMLLQFMSLLTRPSSYL